jgi:hypothetical protein
MGVSATSVAFGSVSLNSPATKTVTLTSSGTGPLNISGVSISGAGFTVSGGTFPAKLSPGASLTLTLQFDPTTAGAAVGQLTVSSNSSSGSSLVVGLTGTGTAVSQAPNPAGVTYYLAPRSEGGSDSNTGLTTSDPWLSPNHDLNCGDIIEAATSSAYDPANFGSGKWGTVACPGKNNVAWLQCAKFDSCKISSTTQGIYVDQSYWGVQGWEVSITGGGDGFCFGAAPEWSNPIEIHHIIFANNVANGCYEGGFSSFNVNTTAGVDYLTIVGNIVYNATQGSAHCYSGIDIFQPIQSDSAAGTHIYVAGNFSYANFDPNPCAGTLPTDGEGIILDTFDGSEGGMSAPYAAQTVVEDNFLVGNGGRGFEIQNNLAGAQHAPIYTRYNTIWGNNTDQYTVDKLCGEVLLLDVANVQIYSNIVAANSANGCGGYPLHAFSAYIANASDQVYDNVAYSLNIEPEFSYDSGAFTYATTNILGASPSFADTTIPTAPTCSGTANVPVCMANMVSNFTPTNTSALAMGYQKPASPAVSDPLFPQWLCNVNLPAGLVTMGCSTAP